MSGREQSIDAEFEQTRSTLSEGLKACRAVLRSYRGLIADESGGAVEHPPADNDERPSSADDRA